MNSPLELSGTVYVRPTGDELYDDLAAVLSVAATHAVGARGAFHVALSGGSTPEPFYVRLVTDPRFRLIPWKQTHLWMVDERRVPAEDTRSNFKMIRETLADHVPLRSRQVHPMPVLEEQAAEAYERTLRGELPEGRLDFVLLGMGEDGHTASLFPQSRALHERKRWVAANDGPGVTPPARLTMTYPLLNAARQVAVLVVGEKKNAALRRVDQQLRQHEPDPLALPITGIQPQDGQFMWFLDAAAAGVPAEDPAENSGEIRGV